MILDLFAGPGGWSEGLRSLGLADVGLEWDRDACLTRAAAGHRTIRADVAAYPVEPFVGRVSGLIASPPCQAFSLAGKGEGRAEIAHLHAAVEACRDGWTAPDREWVDERTPLILEPLRWAWALRPEWVACEQVPPAMPVWEHMADVLRSWGYSATAVILSAEEYGVPQTRKRAFLLASRVRPVSVPKPTHQRYQKGVAQGVGCGADLFGDGLLPWVSMAEALGWTGGSRAWDRRVGGFAEDADVIPDTRPAPTVTLSHGRDVWVETLNFTGSAEIDAETGKHGRYRRPVNAPAPGVNQNAGSWQLRAGTNANVAERDGAKPAPTIRFGDRLNTVRWLNPGQTDTQPNRRLYPDHEPAPTVGFGHDAANWRWQVRTSFGTPHRGKDVGGPAPTLSMSGSTSPMGGSGSKVAWEHRRPATTLVGSFRPDMVTPPGHRDWSKDGAPRQDATDAIRIELHEASVLQGFPFDYPWQGTKTSTFRQVGNCVPVPLAAAVIGALTGADYHDQVMEYIRTYSRKPRSVA